LVDENSKVVGVNYAGTNETNQYFAIDRGTALNVIEQLREGKNVDSIGINGQAVSSEDGSITGIWVSSVESGSPADKAGIEAGDIVTSVENLYLATDGTMKDYCDVLRTHSPEDTLALQVLRWNTQEVLEGQLNGRALEVAYNLDSGDTSDTGTDTASTFPANCSESTDSAYMTCVDDTVSIQVDVPNYWTDFNGGSWTFDDEVIGVAINAAPNLADFQNYYDVEGIFFGASNEFAKYGGYVQFLDYYTGTYSEECTLDGRFEYNDGLYRGKYDQYSNCDGVGGFDAYVLSAVDIQDPTSKIILVEVQTYPGDIATVQKIMDTFYVGF